MKQELDYESGEDDDLIHIKHNKQVASSKQMENEKVTSISKSKVSSIFKKGKSPAVSKPQAEGHSHGVLTSYLS